MYKTCPKNGSYSTHSLPLVFDLSVFLFTGLHCKPEEQIIKGCKITPQIIIIIIFR